MSVGIGRIACLACMHFCFFFYGVLDFAFNVVRSGHCFFAEVSHRFLRLINFFAQLINQVICFLADFFAGVASFVRSEQYTESCACCCSEQESA